MSKNNKDAKSKPEVITIDDGIKASLRQGLAGQKRKSRLKKSLKIGAWIFGSLFLIWAYDALFSYKKGGTGFGLCKVFIELNTRYPIELRYSYVQPMSNTMRIWYVARDAYGQTAFDKMDCTFRPDDTYGMALERVTINRKEMDPAIIEKFNKSIPAILAYPPDLTYPQGLPDNIKNLKLSK